jgi:hypothetical protein
VAVPVPIAPVDGDTDRVQLTGSDYVMYGLITAGTLVGAGIAGLLGYAVYAVVSSVFGAVASGVAVASGALPLVVLVGVVLLCARGRGGARAGGVSLPGVGSASAGLLSGVVSSVATVAGPIPRLLGRATGRGRVRVTPGVAPVAVPVRRSRWRGGRTVRDVTVSSPGSSVVDWALGSASPGVDPAGGRDVSTLSWRARVVARRTEAAASPTARAGVVSAVWSRVSGRRMVDGLGIPMVVPHRGVLASLVLGSAARGAAAAVGSVPRRSGVSARVLGAGSVSVNAHGERVQGRVSTFLFGPLSPTAQLAALANGRRSGGAVGRLRDLVRPREKGGLGQSSDIPLDYLVLLDSLTQRWIDRLRAAGPKDVVYGSWMADDTDRCRFCAVGFLWDEFDSDRWFVAARSRMIAGFKRWYHRDAELLFRAYGPKFLWFISNMHDSGEWSTGQVASFVEATVLKGTDVDEYSN